MNAEDVAASLAVEVAWSPAPREVRSASLRLAPDATVTDALRAAGWGGLAEALEDEAAFAAAGWSAAIWGRACALDDALRDGDRVEVLRALAVAPMEARRARYEAAGGVRELRRRGVEAQRRKN